MRDTAVAILGVGFACLYIAAGLAWLAFLPTIGLLWMVGWLK